MDIRSKEAKRGMWKKKELGSGSDVYVYHKCQILNTLQNTQINFRFVMKTTKIFLLLNILTLSGERVENHLEQDRGHICSLDLACSDNEILNNEIQYFQKKIDLKGIGN